MQKVEIHIRGQIDREWSEWFEGFSIQEEAANLTVLWGEIIDQTALYALLSRLGRLGIELISLDIRPVEPDRRCRQ